MAIFLIDGASGVDRVDAETWAEAESKAAALGATVAGELVDEIEAKAARYASCNLVELKFADDGADAMTFAGYGAVFNNVDLGGDKILPGAFTETLAEHKADGRMPSMFYEHGLRGGGPTMPVGVWTEMREDSKGLWVEGKLFDHSLGRDLYVALKGGAIGGMSIGYRAKEVGRPSMGAAERRQLKTVQLHEVSLVNQPMNPMARLSAVKSYAAKSANELKAEITRLSDLGELLREAAGWSRSQTEAVLSNFQAKSAQGEPDKEAAAIAALLRRNLSILSK